MAPTKALNEVSTSDEVTFPVYLVHSNWSLNQIDGFLKDYGDVGLLRIIYDRDGNETNRTIVVISDKAYANLCKAGYDKRKNLDFVIAPYALRNNNFPGEGKTDSFFIPVPKSLSSHDGFVISAIEDKIRHLSTWGIVEEGSWAVKAPLRSREKGGIRGSCFVTFNKEVTEEQRAMLRVLLTDTYWPVLNDEDDEAEIFSCFWSRERKPRPEKEAPKAKIPVVVEETPQEAEERKKAAIQKIASESKPVPKKQKSAPVEKKEKSAPVEKKKPPTVKKQKIATPKVKTVAMPDF